MLEVDFTSLEEIVNEVLNLTEEKKRKLKEETIKIYKKGNEKEKERQRERVLDFCHDRYIFKLIGGEYANPTKRDLEIIKIVAYLYNKRCCF